MINKIKLANEQIQKTKDYIDNNIDALNYMDLKLHDANYYAYLKLDEDFPLVAKENNIDDLFDLFCENSYDMFVEDLQECHNINFEKMRRQLGRTSKFYLHDRTIFDIVHCEIQFSLESILDNYFSSYCEIADYLNDKDFIVAEKIEEEYDEDGFEGSILEDEIDYIINNMYDDVINYMHDILIVYDLIQNFKNNQIEYFKEYLQMVNEELEYKQEQENQATESQNDLINSIISKCDKLTETEIKFLKKHLQNVE